MKVLGYRYSIHEMYPVTDGDGISKAIVYRDRIEDVQIVLDALYKTDINFTVYVIMAKPIYAKEG